MPQEKGGLMPDDTDYLRRTIRLAREAQQAGNLPIGALIVLDGQVVAEGKNAIWVPRLDPGRHAEIVALAAVSPELWPRGREMTLYTSLEPCLMCLSTILLHRIGRVVYGSGDSRGGASGVFGHMPPAFERLAQPMEWVGPALPQECDPLRDEVFALLDERGLRMWGPDHNPQSP
jgi:tRNA(adenine34) deaminase